ncbi:MAG: cysteine--tRNA ligase [Synergistetes bacterium]|nr:cysteine--tRNA ligase [Synergistota bacterium]MCX8127415.1 cysteine--tRNA ligase [Synergistota bacterium]MDW8192279.1 cysteine--tRNA ligase [Synergistota bacterium]
MSLVFQNTLTKRKEPFRTIESGKVRMYVCGPTVYNYFHIGNARPFIIFDIARRYMEYKGYVVKYVQNFTDIDDKIIKRAHEEGKTWKEIAEKYIEAYFEDADALKIKRASYYPKATEHIKEMIELVSKLIDKGHAYVTDGDVYYDVLSFPEYGKLSGKPISELEAGARIEPDPKKKNPLDFALWKRAKEGEPYWDSPWGKGRPGWHIECSAMSMKHLGETIDIHAGGEDLIFPHHENEIAQTEGVTGKPFCNFWLHNGYLLINEEKMSKSLGNILTARELREKYAPEVLRLFMLSAHYRHPINFSDETLKQAESGQKRIQNAMFNLKDAFNSSELLNPSSKEDFKFSEEIEKSKLRFEESMDDDLNTPEALASIFELVKSINTYLTEAINPKKGLLEKAIAFLNNVNEIFGIIRTEEKLPLEIIEIERLIKEREEARKERNWEKADSIRKYLLSKGIILEDTPTGTRWKLK